MKKSVILFVLFCLGSKVFAQHEIKTNSEIVAREKQRFFLNNSAERSIASNNFDVNYYRLDVSVTPGVQYISGNVTVYFKMTTPGSAIVLDLSNSLTVDSVKQRGQLLSFSRPQDGLRIDLSAPNAAQDSLTIYYKGVPDNNGMGSFTNATHAGVPVLWTLSEPYGSMDWWPCKNSNGDKADSVDVIITHPVAYKAVSNGILQSEINVGAGNMRTHWKHRYPIATYLVCMAVTNFNVKNSVFNIGSYNLPMQTFSFPEHAAAFAKGDTLVMEAMRNFDQWYGAYPFKNEKYGHVEFLWGGGMEHQTCSFIVNTDEYLMAHELGHQWFGNMLTAGSWKDIWLNEGFASQLGYAHIETKYPQRSLNLRRALINSITSSPGGSLLVDDTSRINRVFDLRLSYDKGCYVLYMLRYTLGDSVFYAGVKKYRETYQYGTVTTQDLQRSLESVSGKNLTPFFNDWYRGEGYPTYHVTWQPVGTNRYKIILNQATSHSSVPFFHNSVPVTFVANGQEQTVKLDPVSNNQAFYVRLNFDPDTAIVDKDLWTLSQNNTSAKIDAVNDGSSTVLIMGNPVRDNLLITLNNFAGNKVNFTVYNMAGQTVARSSTSLQYFGADVRIPSSSWVRGQYIVVVEGDSGFKKILKVIK